MVRGAAFRSHEEEKKWNQDLYNREQYVRGITIIFFSAHAMLFSSISGTLDH